MAITLKNYKSKINKMNKSKLLEIDNFAYGEMMWTLLHNTNNESKVVDIKDDLLATVEGMVEWRKYGNDITGGVGGDPELVINDLFKVLNLQKVE